MRQHQPLKLRHAGISNLVVRLEVRQRAEHPADGVAQLAIGIDIGLDDFRADAQIFGIVGARHPQAQDVGAVLVDDVLRRDHIVAATSTSCGRPRP